MCATYQVEVVLLEEVLHDVLPENKRNPPVVLGPARNVFLWVRPDQIAEQPLVGDLHWADDFVDLVEALEVGRESAVHADDLLVDDGADGHAVEAVREYFPDLGVVSAFACIRGLLHSS